MLESMDESEDIENEKEKTPISIRTRANTLYINKYKIPYLSEVVKPVISPNPTVVKVVMT